MNPLEAWRAGGTRAEQVLADLAKVKERRPSYDYGGGQGDDQMDGEPLTREESIWVWSILWTFTLAPIFVLMLIARHL